MFSKKENDQKPNQPKAGIINRIAVNRFLFGVVASSIVISVFMIIFAIWDYVGYEIAHRTVATGITMIGGGILFSFVNDYFGSKMLTDDRPEVQKNEI